MAEKDTKEVVEKKASEKPAKAKVKKPGFFSKLGAWLKSCKSEMKKIVWASWSSVRSNSVMVLVTIIVISALIGLVDLLFSQGIVILSILGGK